jgi:hypothetical protein
MILLIMKTRRPVLLPKAQKTFSILGQKIKLARLRKKYSTQQVAEKENISRPTLLSNEKVHPYVSIGAYFKIPLDKSSKIRFDIK